MKPIVTGVMMYYYFICHRKLWYFSHGIHLEQENELVQIGRIIDENTFQRSDKHIDIDSVINIDFIRSKKELHEVKKSKAIEQAGIWQLKYYLYYLEERGVTGIHGMINYPTLREKINVSLENGDREIIANSLKEIVQIIHMLVPPHFSRQRICNRCAYFDFCYL